MMKEMKTSPPPTSQDVGDLVERSRKNEVLLLYLRFFNILMSRKKLSREEGKVRIMGGGGGLALQVAAVEFPKCKEGKGVCNVLIFQKSRWCKSSPRGANALNETLLTNLTNKFTNSIKCVFF